MYDAVHLPLSAGLCRQGKQVQRVWAHKCVIRLSARQTVPLDSDLWLFPQPLPPTFKLSNGGAPLPEGYLSTAAESKPSTEEGEGFYFEIAV